jgi:hypothetical protein
MEQWRARNEGKRTREAQARTEQRVDAVVALNGGDVLEARELVLPEADDRHWRGKWSECGTAAEGHAVRVGWAEGRDQARRREEGNLLIVAHSHHGASTAPAVFGRARPAVLID